MRDIDPDSPENQEATKQIEREKFALKMQEINWRLGTDHLAHAIRGCDPMASGWIAECGRFITGQKSTKRIKCPYCIEKVEPNE